VSMVRLANSGGVTTMTLDCPPVNALGKQLVADIEDALAALRDDETVRCLVVRSAGKHFCAGADLKERRTMTEEEVLAFVPRLAGVCHGLAGLPFPTIAAVRGAAVGGGCELALGCDIRVLADDTKIGLRETALAIIPGAGGTQRLPRLIGPARAKRWIFAAELHDAATALTDGVADRVVPAKELDQAAHALAATIAANGPLAVKAILKSIRDTAGLPESQAFEVEMPIGMPVFQSKDAREGPKAFLEKRKAVFTGE